MLGQLLEELNAMEILAGLVITALFGTIYLVLAVEQRRSK
jgi:hypothetical protein